MVLVSVGGCILVLLGAALVFGQSGSTAEAADPKILFCAADNSSTGRLNATIGVMNTERSPRSYLITVAFTSNDGKVQFGTGTALVQDLQPGQGAAPTATAYSRLATSTDLVCRITRVR